MTEDIMIAADRQEVNLGEEFAVLIAPRQLGHRDRTASGMAYVITVDDSWSMSIKADSTRDEMVDPANPNDVSRKNVAEAGVYQLASALAPSTAVKVITFGQHAGVRFNGTAGELRRKGRWNGNVDDERRWTNIEEALERSYRELESLPGGSRRVVLLSDGIPNFGITEPGQLAAVARAAADRDLHTDVIGIGAGADFGLLEKLAPTGMTEHVASRATAAQAMKQITARFAEYGKSVIAGGGELSLTVNPHFAVTGAYQFSPVRRPLDGAVSDGGGRRPSEVRIKLGAVAEGHDGQPRFLLRLRAPERVSDGPMPVLKATGSIGSGSGARSLAPGMLALRTVDDEHAQILKPEFGRAMAAVDLEREINGRAANARTDAERIAVYQEGVERARSIPDPDLPAVFQQAMGGLRAGLQPKDVANEARAASSRSSTRDMRDWFEKVEVETPEEIRARRRQQNLDDDEDEEDYDDAYGATEPQHTDPDAPTLPPAGGYTP